VLEVRAHSAARHHFISGNTYNMYANQGGLEKLTVDFVARIEPDGSMAWYRQFALAPSLSMATAPKETNLPKSTDGYVAFEVEGLGTSASGDVVVLGRRDDGIVSFTVDADTGDLLPSPQRKSIAVEVPPELGAECSP
jgi:hypothetical protein